jgi:hypothetical protein
MTPFLEACVLPALLLTVVLAGAIRPSSEVTLAPPSLAALVVAMTLIALYVRSGALAPERLMNVTRTALANLNGLTVLLTLFAASAQVVTLVVPDSGVPALIVWVVLISLIVQAFAMGSDRARLLQGLLVTFGATFVLKFVVLAAISVPAEGRVARALQLLFEGVTLGSVSQRVPHVAEGYLAFATLVLYLIGVAWLPSATWRMVRSDGQTFELQDGQVGQVRHVGQGSSGRHRLPESPDPPTEP